MDLKSIADYLAQEWVVIASAPLNFAAAIVIVIAVAWAVVNWAYKARLSSAAGQIDLLERQRDEYRDKIGTATPDQVKETIAKLEERLSRFEPRTLTKSQRDTLVSHLRLSKGVAYNLVISHDASCVDCNSYAAQLAMTIKSVAGWSVVEPLVMGLPSSVKSPTGVSLLVEDQESLSPEADILINALKAAGVQFDILDGHPGGLPGNRWGLLVTARTSLA